MEPSPPRRKPARGRGTVARRPGPSSDLGRVDQASATLPAAATRRVLFALSAIRALLRGHSGAIPPAAPCTAPMEVAPTTRGALEERRRAGPPPQALRTAVGILSRPRRDGRDLTRQRSAPSGADRLKPPAWAIIKR